MPRVSKVKLRKIIDEEAKDNFSFLVSSLRNPSEIEHFFQEFLTQEEKLMLAKRLMLHLMLANRNSTTEMSSILNVSRETIRVHKQLWFHAGNLYKNIIAGLANRKRTKDFWKKIERMLTPLDLALRSGSDMKARAKFASGDWSDD